MLSKNLKLKAIGWTDVQNLFCMEYHSLKDDEKEVDEVLDSLVRELSYAWATYFDLSPPTDPSCPDEVVKKKKLSISR